MKMRSLLTITGLVILAATGCNPADHRLVFRNGDVSMKHVRLLPGPFQEAQQRDLMYLKSLSSDRMLATFRQTAGLKPKAEGYTGWEERELRGHFTGHYLSACAMMWASTGDTTMLSRVRYIAGELYACQKANGDGYISAFPREFIDRAEAAKPVWAPYYTIHKILAGLVDAWTWCADSTALEVASGMAGWIGSRCSLLTDEQMQTMLDHTEQGGMNEVLYELYAITGKPAFKDLARRFYQNSYFIPLAAYRDTLKGQHVNSFIPNVIGISRGYELTADEPSRRIAEFFWKTVTGSRSFVTGGTSNGEVWGSDPYHIHSELGPSSHESCCTYNMLKLTRHLWQWRHDPAYSDYYERALWNGILPTQHPVSAMSMYYVPMLPGYYKTFGTPETSFWCCTGTGVENFARAGECIYAADSNQLYIDQFIASELRLDSAGFSLIMETRFPDEEMVGMRIGLKTPASFGLNIRIPGWISADPVLTVNGRKIDYSCSAPGYLRINRTWRNNDRITLQLPMALRLECMPDSPDTCAVLFGPLVLAGKLGNPGLDDKKTYGHYGPYNDKPVAVPNLVSKGLPEKWIRRKGDELVFTAPASTGGEIELIPFFRLFDERFSVYWGINQQD
jgi:DUF1680 family protein